MSGVDALLPVLVAELADAGERRTLAELAKARYVCLVPVVAPPVDAGLHVLEVTAPDDDEPLLLLVEPVGAPTDRGFPLRLHPYGEAPEKTAGPLPAPDALPFVRPTRARPATLTRLHTQDLLGEGRDGRDALEEEPEALVGRELANGKLVVEELVALGGMGAVYRARHKQLDKPVAVKVLHARYREDLAFSARFHAEALAISALDHPNLVRVFDYGQEPDGLLYLAMDLLTGVELSDVLKLHGALPLPRIVEIAMQVAAGLGHAHARGIVHRDVKPSNILVVKSDDDDGRAVDAVKVCDFGIATHAGASELVGTPAYMSPEQCTGASVDARTDVYSLGVILYELATGELPFDSEERASIVEMQRSAQPPRPSGIRPVDPRLEELIVRMLAKDPAARPQSMRIVRSELRALSAPPPLELHDVGAGRTARSGGGPESSRLGPTLKSSTQFVAVNPHRIAIQLAAEPASTLREHMATPERFAEDARTIAAAMRLLLDHGEIAALANVVAILRRVAGDPTAGARAELSARLLRTLMDPSLLAPIADRALAEPDESPANLLAGLGPAAASALYAARQRAHPTPPLRGRFVGAMRSLGTMAWPIVSAALSRDAPGESDHHDPRLAEDLLRSVPDVQDDSVGNVVAKYLRWGEPAVRRAAVRPLAALWGDRARALLLAVLVKDDDLDARISAIRGLRHLRAIDEHIVRKAATILEGGTVSQTAPANDALQQAVAEALGDANEDARELAASTLKRALSPKGGVLGMLRTKVPAVAPPVLLALARSYVRVGGADAAALVDLLVKSVDEPLKSQLASIAGAGELTA